MKIIVLLKQVPDTYEERKLDAATGILDREASEPIIDEIVERAIETALSYKDAHKDTEIVLLSMGPDSVTASLRKALSLGADSAVHVLDDGLAGSDLARTAAVLAAALATTGYDLIIAGNESTDGRGGAIPAMVAEHLQPAAPHRHRLGGDHRRRDQRGARDRERHPRRARVAPGRHLDHRARARGALPQLQGHPRREEEADHGHVAGRTRRC